MNNKFISKSSECNILQFISCKFDSNYSVLIISGKPTKEELAKAFDDIYTEYIDFTGTAIPEISIMKQVKALECRNQAVDIVLKLQWQAIDFIGIPFFNGFPLLERNRHKLTWNNNIDDFKQQLRRAEATEKRYVSELDTKNKQLETFRANQPKGQPHNSDRTDFIRLLNELQKFGYKIDKQTTSIEELGIMVHDYTKTMESSMDNMRHN